MHNKVPEQKQKVSSVFSKLFPLCLLTQFETCLKPSAHSLLDTQMNCLSKDLLPGGRFLDFYVFVSTGQAHRGESTALGALPAHDWDVGQLECFVSTKGMELQRHSGEDWVLIELCRTSRMFGQKESPGSLKELKTPSGLHEL